MSRLKQFIVGLVIGPERMPTTKQVNYLEKHNLDAGRLPTRRGCSALIEAHQKKEQVKNYFVEKKVANRLQKERLQLQQVERELIQEQRKIREKELQDLRTSQKSHERNRYER